MHARFVMDPHFARIDAQEPVGVARWLLASGSCDELYVTDPASGLYGVLRAWDSAWQDGQLAGDVAEPVDVRSRVTPESDVGEVQRILEAHPDWRSVPVVAGSRVVGVVRRDALRSLPRSPGRRMSRVLTGLYPTLIDSMASGILLVNREGVVVLLNRYGADILGVRAEDVIGRPYVELAEAIFPDVVAYLRGSAVPGALGTGAATGDRQLRLPSGKEVLFRFAAWGPEGRRRYVVVTFMDVTALREAEARNEALASEAERAFGLTLPNSKVESKLRASPEYQDRYDPTTGRAVVTGVIPDGTYRHVINGLRIMADLKNLGAFQLVGIDKDTLVRAFMFHDVGKEQPRLSVGQEFVPEKTFEPGPLHAARSAAWASHDYHLTEEETLLIQYHHTKEEDLPESFPLSIVPMYRLIRLVDGLSASVTRRSASISLVRLDGSVLEIHEDNPDPRYDSRYRLSLYTGWRGPCEHHK